MQLVKYVNTWGRAAVVLALLLFLGAQVNEAQAQWIPKWLNVGDFQGEYLSSVAGTEADEIAWHHPGIRPRSSFGRWRGLWISARNVTDETGRQWPVRVSHSGVRITGVGEVFDMRHDLFSKYPQPSVQVDEADTFSEPVVVDEVDPSLPADRMIVTEANFSIGVSVERRAMAWSHPDHDDYHIVEYTFTNTGNVDDDDDIELPDQTLDDVYFTFLERTTGAASFSGAWNNSAGGVAWGQYTMNDAIGDGVSDYGVDFRAQMSWLGNVGPTTGLEDGNLNTLGNPMWSDHQWRAIADDTLGRLNSPTFTGQLTIHADAQAHDAGATAPDDPLQPSTMTYMNNDFGDLTSGSSHTDEPKMVKERKWIECGSTPTVGGGVPGYEGEDNCTPGPGGTGRTWPTHARIVQGQTAEAAHDSDPDFANQTADPSRGGGAGGWSWMSSYGPYDMAPGQQVKIVHAVGVGRLDPEAEFQIGRAYKLSSWNDDLIHEFDADGNGTIDADEAMTKNEWVMTARDTLFQLFERAIDTYNGGNYRERPVPAPPTSFLVTSGTDRVLLEWDGPQPAGGWEIWRAQKHYSGIITALSVGSNGIAVPDMARQYVRIATPGAGETSYADTQVERGGDYFYYLQAVGSDGVKSSRYYAQTYNPARLKRPPGSSLAQVRIVPNPYHLGAEPGVHVGGDVRDRLAFYELPGQARIEIFSELGELVNTIEHTDDSGDEFWDLTTSSRQVVASGVYIAVITNTETGENTIQKFIVIR